MSSRSPDPKKALATIAQTIVVCRACPRLVRWREQVAREKRARYRDETYWGRPLPGFGDPKARIVIVGLAPGAHGANRTGRVFTGDRSGDFLFAALHRVGLANQPTSVSRNDRLELRGVFVTLPVRCVPPDNKPAPDEIARCAPFLDRELDALASKRVLVALGAVAWRSCIAYASRVGAPIQERPPKFAHGVRLELESLTLLGSYHVSQQNTQTGRLTQAMFDAVLHEAKALASL